MTTQTIDQLAQQNEDLRRGLQEAEDTLLALRTGLADAVVVGTEREQIYTLETADKPYRWLVMQIPQSAAVLTPDGTVLFCNQRFAESLRRPVQDLIGTSIRSCLLPASLPLFDGLLGQGEVEDCKGEVTFQRADGSPWPVYLGFSALREGVAGQCLVVTDLTEEQARKTAERFADRIAQLQQLTAALSEAVSVDGVAEAIITNGLATFGASAGVVALLSDDTADLVTLRVVGYSPETAERLARLPADAPLPIADAVRLGRPIVLETVTERNARYPALLTWHTFDGEGALVALPLAVHGRTIGGLRLTFSGPRTFSADDLAYLQNLAQQCAQALERARLYDAERRLRERAEQEIEDRKRVETALRQSEERLRSAVNQLAENDRRKNEFLATLAHELRNPLAPIMTAAYLMQMRGTEDPSLRWAQSVLLRQTQQLTRLVDDLLDVSRITQGRVQLRPEPVELAVVVERAVETSKPVIDAKHHQLTVTLPPKPIRLHADSTRLAQVFANLLNNAAKYMEPGGRIWLTAHLEGQQLVVRVRDAGVGIPSDMLSHVFELFTQVDRSLDRSQGGLGIGLHLVQSLVKMHGGTVTASSEGPGKGSEFVVRLPVLTEALLENAAPSEAPAQSRAQSLRILVVDDNADTARVLVMLLCHEGHDATAACDGQAAIEAALAGKPDVILLDIGLPGMDGFEVCRRLRQEPGLEHTMLVALTGYGKEEDRRQSQEAGFDAHLVKPVGIEQLQKTLSQHKSRKTPSPSAPGSTPWPSAPGPTDFV